MREACSGLSLVVRCRLQDAVAFQGPCRKKRQLGIFSGTPDSDSVQIRLQGAATTQLLLAVFSLARSFRLTTGQLLSIQGASVLCRAAA